MVSINQKIPEGWSVKKLGECFSFLKTPSYSRAETTSDGEVHYIHYGDIHTKYPLHVCPEDIDIFVTNEQAQKGDFLQTGDLILLDASEDYDGTTKCIELTAIKDSDKVISGLHTLALRDNYNNFVNGFRAYITSMPFVKNNFWKQVTGIKVYGVSKDNLKKLKLLLPPLAEQKKIAGILGTWDEAIEKLSDLIEHKKLLKKGLMQKLLTGKVRLPGFTQPWKEVKLGDFLKEHTEKTTENDQYQVLSVTKNGICSQEEYFEKQIASENNIGYKILRKHDIVFSPMNLWMGSIGFSEYDIGIVSPAYKIFSVNENVALFSFLKHFMIINRMIYLYLINSEQGASIVRRNLDLDGLLSSKVSIPDITEQQAIADVLSAADDEIDLLNKKLILFKEQKKGLMQQLLTGNIRVKVN